MYRITWADGTTRICDRQALVTRVSKARLARRLDLIAKIELARSDHYEDVTAEFVPA